MNRSLFLVFVAVSPFFTTTVACSNDDGDTTSGHTGGGHGGKGGSAGSSGSHAGSCKSCGDFLMGAAVSPAELCGFQGHGTGSEITCEPDTSCQKFSDLFACICGSGETPLGACNDPGEDEACAANACLASGWTPDTACEACIDDACGAELGACHAALM
jgi:hypothetical protein